MNESTALALSSERELTPKIFQMIRDMAPIMWRSKLFGVTSEEAAAAIMLKGFEMGLSITASFEFLQVVMGRPSLSPRGALAILQGHPEITKIVLTKILGDQNQFVGYECTMARKSGFEYTAKFTMSDAQRAGVVKPDSGWVHYPENMCMWRAIGFCADVVAPDITGGLTGLLKFPEGVNVEIADGGKVIDLQVRNVAEPAPVETAPVVTLDQLIDLFGVDKVLEVAGGRLPGTDKEVNDLANKLVGEE
jgi:hypothetical protein